MQPPKIISISKTNEEESRIEIGMETIAQGFEIVLNGLSQAFGLDLSDPNLAETPVRVARAYKELFSGLKDTDKQIEQILSKTFPCEESSDMIVVTGIITFGVCPHHLLPILYKTSVAYIPEVGGEVLGISKLPRLVEILSKRPVLQEKFTKDITKHLMTLKKCSGAACFVIGEHYCTKMRGVRQVNSETITSSMRGIFSDEPATKSEFLRLAKGV